MRDVILIAASGLAREAAGMASPAHRVIGMVDDDPRLHGSVVGGVEVLGPVERAATLRADLVVCVGSGAGRRRLVERLAALGVGPARYAALVDESVHVGAGSRIGAGSILLAGSVLTADVRVGDHVVVMPHCTLTHDDVVDDFATLAAGVALGGGVRIGEAAYLGMSASVRQRVSVAAHATVGMGAVVLGDVPAGETWAGVPARPLGQRVEAVR